MFVDDISIVKYTRALKCQNSHGLFNNRTQTGKCRKNEILDKLPPSCLVHYKQNGGITTCGFCTIFFIHFTRFKIDVYPKICVIIIIKLYRLF